MWWVWKKSVGKTLYRFPCNFLSESKKTEGIVLWQQPADNEARVKYVVYHSFYRVGLVLRLMLFGTVCVYIRCQLKRWSLITKRYVFQCCSFHPNWSREMSNWNTTTVCSMQHAQKWKDIELSREKEWEIFTQYKDTKIYQLYFWAQLEFIFAFYKSF